MTQNTYKDIEKFLMDDELFQWAKNGSAAKEFDLKSYKLRHPGCENQIDLAIAIIRGVKINEAEMKVTSSYKTNRLNEVIRRAQMSGSTENSEFLEPKSLKSIRHLWFTSVASVAAILLLCFGVYQWMLNTPSVSSTQQLALNTMDSLRHSKQVQVILNGEQTVGLDQNNAEIKVESNGAVRVDKKLVAEGIKEKVLTNKVIVPYGKRSKIHLPDGSTLWINSGSSISYASDFLKNRILNVQGEVYLDVKKDAAHPFVVKTNRMEVTVLGTTFNVTDYERDKETAVVLVQGSVDVTLENNLKKRLVPNQRLTIQDGDLKVDEVDVYQYTCWKDDLMIFKEQKLRDILKSLSRYYDVHIEMSDSLKDEIYHGTLDLNGSIDDVLSTISLVTPLQITRDKDVIYIKPNK